MKIYLRTAHYKHPISKASPDSPVTGLETISLHNFSAAEVSSTQLHPPYMQPMSGESLMRAGESAG